MKKNYYGNVEVTVKMSYRLDADFSKKPTKESVLKALVDQTFNDILDEEVIEILSVDSIDDFECQKE